LLRLVTGRYPYYIIPDLRNSPVLWLTGGWLAAMFAGCCSGFLPAAAIYLTIKINWYEILFRTKHAQCFYPIARIYNGANNQ
jgi:hypothetical protein